MQGTNRLAGREEKSLLRDPGFELRLGGRDKKKGEDNEWDGKKKQNKKTGVLPRVYHNRLYSRSSHI